MNAHAHLGSLLAPPEGGRAATLVDVGAAAGADARWGPFRQLIQVVGFEPQAEEFAKLQQSPGQRWIQAALAGSRGRRTLHLTRYWSNCSLLRPNPVVLQQLEWGNDHEVIEERPLDCVTLDECLRAEGVRPDFLKVDTQGTELEILTGARSALEQAVQVVEVEVEFTPLYQAQPLFADVDQFLRAAGFQLQDLGNFLYVKPRGMAGVGGVKGQLVSADALYFKDLATAPEHLDRLNEQAVRAALLGYAAYGYPEKALMLLQQLATAGRRLPQHAALAAAFAELRPLPRALGWLPARDLVAKCGQEIWRRLQVVRGSWWHGPLGNRLR